MQGKVSWKGAETEYIKKRGIDPWTSRRGGCWQAPTRGAMGKKGVSRCPACNSTHIEYGGFGEKGN